MPLLLTALCFDALDPWLRAHRVDGPVAIIDNAAHGLDERDAIVAAALQAVSSSGCTPQLVNVVNDGPEALHRAAAVVMTGGDPFRLLVDLKRSGADLALVEAHAAGRPIAGQSAGAMVCAADLGPVRLTSPFDAAPDQDLTGLALTTTLVLPHHGRPERNARHRQAALAAGADPGVTLIALWDDEARIEQAGAWSIHRDSRVTRPARGEDAPAVAEVFHQAALAAWSGFLGPGIERQPTALWAQRIATAGLRFLVTEDAEGVVSFVCWRTTDDGAGGEIDLLYTHPRAWGDGSGRRLLERATWQLLCEGFREAVLWTEARNQRALAVYRRNGWRLDGAVEEREFSGRPIRNLRHRLDLTRYAGGA